MLRHREVGQGGCHSLSARRLEVPELRGTGIGEVKAHDPAIVGIVRTSHQATLLHPAYQPGRRGQPGAEQLGDPAHCQWAVRLEHGHDVEVRHADRPIVAALREGRPLTSEHRVQLVEKLLVDALRATNGSWHANHYADAKFDWQPAASGRRAEPSR